MRLKGRNNIFAGQTLNLPLFKGETAKDRVKCLVNPDWAASPDSLSLSKQIKGLETGLIGIGKKKKGKVEKVIHVLSHASGPLFYITTCLCF